MTSERPCLVSALGVLGSVCDTPPRFGGAGAHQGPRRWESSVAIGASAPAEPGATRLTLWPHSFVFFFLISLCNPLNTEKPFSAAAKPGGILGPTHVTRPSALLQAEGGGGPPPRPLFRYHLPPGGPTGQRLRGLGSHTARVVPASCPRAPLWLLPRTGGGGGRWPTGPLPQHCVPEGPGKGPTRGEDSSASEEGGDPKGAGAREGAVGWVRPGRGLSPHRPVGSFQQLQPLPGQVGPGGWGVEAGEGVLPAQPRSHAPAGPPAPQPRRAAQPGHRAAGQAEAAEEGAGVLHVLQPLRQVQPRRALPLHPRPREGGRVHQVTAGASRAGGPRLWPQQRLTPSSPSAQVRPGHVQED